MCLCWAVIVVDMYSSWAAYFIHIEWVHVLISNKEKKYCTPILIVIQLSEVMLLLTMCIYLMSHTYTVWVQFRRTVRGST